MTSQYLLASLLIADADHFFFSVHWKILIRARRTQREIAAEKINFERNRSNIEAWYRIKGARMTAIMLCGIFLCYAPQMFTGAVIQYLENSQSCRIAFYWTTALMLLNSFVNPIMYIWQMKWFRDALRKVALKREMSVINNCSEAAWQINNVD